MNAAAASARPDGIEDEHAGVRGKGWTNPIGLVVLSVMVAVAMLGTFGNEHIVAASGGGVDLEVQLPARIRSGELFEMRFTVVAHEALTELALTVDESVWEDMTINTIIPAATEESSEDGRYRFTFGPMAPGTLFELKVDGQINPDLIGGTSGVIGVYDGEQRLVELPLEIGVLP